MEKEQVSLPKIFASQASSITVGGRKVGGVLFYRPRTLTPGPIFSLKQLHRRGHNHKKIASGDGGEGGSSVELAALRTIYCLVKAENEPSMRRRN